VGARVAGPDRRDRPLERWKTHILELRGELVPRLIVLVGPFLLVLVAFEGTTLVGDARRVPAAGCDDLEADPALVAALREDVASAFAGRRTDDVRSAKAR
jgi:hypothetical protein